MKSRIVVLIGINIILASILIFLYQTGKEKYLEYSGINKQVLRYQGDKYDISLLKTEIKSLSEQLQAIDHKIDQSQDQLKNIAGLYKVADETRVDRIISIEPGEKRKDGEIKVIPFHLELVGKYRNIMRFISGVEKLLGNVGIESVSFKKSKNKLLSSRLVISFYST